MARGFMNGVIAGGLIGAAVGMFLLPQMKQNHGMKGMMSRTRKVKGKAGKIFKGLEDFVD